MASSAAGLLHLDNLTPRFDPSNTGQRESHDTDASVVSARIPNDQHPAQTLAPVDGGYHAWMTLTICFILEGVLWSFPLSFGVFQNYYSTHRLFSSASASSIAAIGTTSTGLAYFLAPVGALLLQRWPRHRPKGMVLGLIGTVMSLVAASWSKTVGGLLATQGVLYGISCLALYLPAVTYIDEWFVRRKGLAYGVMWAGTGTGGTVMPFVQQWLLERWGYVIALRVSAISMALLCLPCVLCLKPRLPTSASATLRPQDLSFMKHTPFWLFTIGVLGWSLGFTLPPLWLPSFAADIHLPTFAGPLSLALYNAAYSLGSISFGVLVDRFHVSLPIFISSLGLMTAAFVFWGLTASQPMLYMFAMLWGMFGGGFTVTWSGCAAVLRRLEPSGNVDTTFVLALLAAAKGVGSVVGGPLSARLLDVGWQKGASFAYGTQFGPVVIFSGLSVMIGTTACVGKLFKIL